MLGAVGFTVGRYGVGSLGQLFWLVVLFYMSVALFVVVALGAVMRWRAQYLSLPRLSARGADDRAGDGLVGRGAAADHAQARIYGVRKSVVGLVVPTGYSFNLDAFSIYLTLGGGVPGAGDQRDMSFGDMLLVLLVSLLTSKGAHGVPGSRSSFSPRP